MIAVAGLDQTGTRSAAEFVSTPTCSMPHCASCLLDVRTKKIQLVLHANIVDYVPTSYDVIASSVQ